MKHWFIADPYEWPVLIFIGKWKEFRKYLKRKYNEDVGDQEFFGGAHYRMHRDGDGFSAIWMPEFDHNDVADMRVLSHELLHATMYMLHHSGVCFDYDNQEALCYSHEAMNRRAYEVITGRG